MAPYGAMEQLLGRLAEYKIYLVALVVILALAILFKDLNLTGGATGLGDVFSQPLQLNVNGNTDVAVNVDSLPFEKFALTSIRLSGSVSGDKNVKIYAENDRGTRFLIFDGSSISASGGVAISGQATEVFEGVIDDVSVQNQIVENQTVPNESNITETNTTTPIEVAPVENATPIETISEPVANFTEPNITGPMENQTINQTAIENVTNTTQINVNISVENQTVIENITNTTQINVNISVENQTAIENITNVTENLTSVSFTFNSICFETCDLTGKEFSNKTLKLVFEASENTNISVNLLEYTAKEIPKLGKLKKSLLKSDFKSSGSKPLNFKGYSYYQDLDSNSNKELNVQWSSSNCGINEDRSSRRRALMLREDCLIENGADGGILSDPIKLESTKTKILISADIKPYENPAPDDEITITVGYYNPSKVGLVRSEDISYRPDVGAFFKYGFPDGVEQISVETTRSKDGWDHIEIVRIVDTLPNSVISDVEYLRIGIFPQIADTHQDIWVDNITVGEVE